MFSVEILANEQDEIKIEDEIKTILKFQRQ